MPLAQVQAQDSCPVAEEQTTRPIPGQVARTDDARLRRPVRAPHRRPWTDDGRHRTAACPDAQDPLLAGERPANGHEQRAVLVCSQVTDGAERQRDVSTVLVGFETSDTIEAREVDATSGIGRDSRGSAAAETRRCSAAGVARTVTPPVTGSQPVPRGSPRRPRASGRGRPRCPASCAMARSA